MKTTQYLKAIIIVLLCPFTDVRAQLSTNEKPVSFGKESELSLKSRSTNAIVTMPSLDVAKLKMEDIEDEEFDVPPRFGYPHRVSYNMDNSGIWYELPNGDKLWQLEIICPNSLSVNVCYDKFWIPDGGKFFIFSKDKTHSIGAFTYKNNKGDSLNIRGFATGLIYGNDIILEYYQAKDVSADAIISIEYIVHGYKYISIGNKFLGDSGDCQVNVNCDEGQNWQNEKKAVALMLVNGYRYCTGSLINTTDLSQKPYLLTANHCLGGGANYNHQYDANTSPNLDHYSFYWNYETPGCLNTNIEPTHYSTSGATVLANNSISDFALLRLAEDPKDIPSYIPYYLGWDHSGNCGVPGVCIHHPRGDVKKISSVATQPVSTSYLSYIESINANHWKVTWKPTQNGYGTTEGGSSGSPLLTANHKVIGQLHGGYANCGDSITAPDWYGKFDVSWTGNNNSSTLRRLDCWLDSLNTGYATLEGLLIISSSITMNSEQQLYCNIHITGTGQLTVLDNIELMGYSRVVVESDGKLVVDGGTLSNVDLVLTPGASLKIINGGYLKTRNGFKAPVGAKVVIENGKLE